jgi:hypothetical protein
MLVKEQNKRANSTELTRMLENVEKMTEIAKITYKVN